MPLIFSNAWISNVLAISTKIFHCSPLDLQHGDVSGRAFPSSMPYSGLSMTSVSSTNAICKLQQSYLGRIDIHCIFPGRNCPDQYALPRQPPAKPGHCSATRENMPPHRLGRFVLRSLLLTADGPFSGAPQDAHALTRQLDLDRRIPAPRNLPTQARTGCL